jgi:hypothetical protein
VSDEKVRCRNCIDGRWETECCGGFGGCDCLGQPIDMGPCNVCGGTGWHAPDADTRANLRQIEGQCFIGNGPTSGYWADHGARGHKILR